MSNSTCIEKGGKTYITTGDISAALPRFQKEKWRMIHPPSHLHYFSKKTLTLLLERYDLKVVRIDTVMFGGHIQNVVHAPAVKLQSQDDQRLGINLPVDAGDKEFSEIGGVYIIRPKSPFARVEAGSSQIIIPGQNVRCSESRRGREQQSARNNFSGENTAGMFRMMKHAAVFRKNDRIMSAKIGCSAERGMSVMNYQFGRLFLALDERHLVAGAWPAKSRRIAARQAGELASFAGLRF